MTEYLEEKVRRLEKQIQELKDSLKYGTYPDRVGSIEYCANDTRLIKIIGERKPHLLQVKDDKWIEYKPVEMAVWQEIKECVRQMHSGHNDCRSNFLYEAIKKVDPEWCPND